MALILFNCLMLLGVPAVIARLVRPWYRGEPIVLARWLWIGVLGLWYWTLDQVVVPIEAEYIYSPGVMLVLAGLGVLFVVSCVVEFRPYLKGSRT